MAGLPVFGPGRAETGSFPCVLVACLVLVLVALVPPTPVSHNALPRPHFGGAAHAPLPTVAEQTVAAARASLSANVQSPPAPGQAATIPTWTIHEFQRSGFQPAMVYDAADSYVLLFQGLQGNVSNSTWTYSAGQWNEIPTSMAPSSRVGEAMAYDAADKEVILFGGANPSGWANAGPFYNDTWIFKGGNWSLATPAGHVAPGPRQYASMAYDSGSNETLLFGGTDLIWNASGCQGQNWGDTWAFSGGAWTRLAGPAGMGPAARYGAALSYDPNLRAAVLFGGAVYECSQNSTLETSDTWTFSAGKWTTLSAGSPSPSARLRANLVFDPVSNRTVLFGGSSGGIPFDLGQGDSNDTWVLSGGTWKEMHTRGPPTADAAGPLIYDPALGGLLLFGVRQWEWTNGTWSETGPSPYPPQLAHASLTYDAADGYVLLFGYNAWSSIGGGDQTAWTWKFDQGRWTNLSEPNASTPPWSYTAAMTYDPVDRYVVLFGGDWNWTWKFVGGTWSDLNTTHGPPAGYGSRIAFDSRDGFVLLFGGSDCFPGYWWVGCQWRSDTWKFVGGAWSQILSANASPPPGRSYGVMAYDPALRAVVMFGGEHCDAANYTCLALNDTWSFSGGGWTQLAVHDSPSGRAGGSAVYSLAEGGIVLVGGTGVYQYGDYKPGVGGTWVLHNGSWTQLGFPGQLQPGVDVESTLASVPQLGQEVLYTQAAQVWILQGIGFPVQLNESGLPAGTGWGANVGGVWEWTSSTSMEFIATSGTFTFGVAVPTGFASTPTSGSVRVTGGPVNVSIQFGPAHWVRFFAMGLPRGTDWNVSLGTSRLTSTSPTAWFNVSNGTYVYSIGRAGGLLPEPSSGSVRVSGSNVFVAIAFVPPVFSLTFTESGLPAGTFWSVSVGGVLSSATATSISFAEPNGSFGYSVSSVPGFTTPPAGNVTVRGASPPIQLIYGHTLFTLAFHEVGLPNGTSWGVFLDGHTQTASGSNVTFPEPNGSYQYVLLAVRGYVANFSAPAVVNGADSVVNLTFEVRTYSIVFRESGLPSGTSWSVIVSNASAGFIETWSSDRTSIVLSLPNGTYSVLFGLPSGFHGVASSNSFTVVGSSGLGAILTAGPLAAVPANAGPMPDLIWEGAILALIGTLAVALAMLRRRRPPTPSPHRLRHLDSPGSATGDNPL